MKDKEKRNLNRREFLKLMAAGGAAAYGLGFGVSNLFAQLVEQNPANSKSNVAQFPHLLYPGKVVLARRQGVINSSGAVKKELVLDMLNKALNKFSEEKEVKDAWRKVLKLEPDDVIGIKINAIAGKDLTSSPVLIGAITDGLISAGIKPGNIIVWDRTDRELLRGGYQIKSTPGEIRYFGTHPSSEYDNQNIRLLGGKQIRFSKILTQHISILINVPILKDHRTTGVTVAMKNHYGSFDIPQQFHSNNCDPWIAELNALPEIKEKTRLIVVDALRPLCEGGPGDNPRYRWNFSSIILADDPVACDYIGWQVIDERRKEIGLPLLANSNRAPKYIFTAGRLGLGIAERALIKLISA